MKHSYSIEGMTCNGCVASVKDKLSKVKGVDEVAVSLEKKEAQITMDSLIPLIDFKAVLPDKFSIDLMVDADKVVVTNEIEKSKLQQLKPLLLIFLYLFSAVFLMNFRDWNTNQAMLDFMGMFYIVFSFFKLLDLKGFPESFSMYDPLAKLFPFYGKLYPFIELGLGILFLMRIQLRFAIILTVIILGITTIGVTKSLIDKKSIRCACLGTALKLPMTEATFIENAIMLVMAFWMFFNM